jgi:hypothetical protein
MEFLMLIPGKSFLHVLTSTKAILVKLVFGPLRLWNLTAFLDHSAEPQEIVTSRHISYIEVSIWNCLTLFRGTTSPVCLSTLVFGGADYNSHPMRQSTFRTGSLPIGSICHRQEW